MIIQAETPEQTEKARRLFREYEAWLGVDLCFQSVRSRTRRFARKIRAADRKIVFSEVDEKIAGCIALRKLEDETCEMKRLFVREPFRGLRLGKKLIEKIIAGRRKTLAINECVSILCPIKCRKPSNFTILTAFTKYRLIMKIRTNAFYGKDFINEKPTND